MVCRAVRKVHDEVKASPLPDLPVIWSEYNASYMTEPAVTDAVFMGPWLANTIRQCDGLVDMLSYWTFSDVFEEQGVVRTPFYGGYGLIAEGNIPKPAFNAFRLLHRLGNQRIDTDSASALVTRATDGHLAIAVWNLGLPEEPSGTKNITLQFKGLKAGRAAAVSRVDATHGSVLAAYDEMGKPAYPTQSQIKELQTAAQLPSPESIQIRDEKLELTLPPDGLALIEVQ
jgi:xylan 1,4-beta-xylosidase